MLVGLDRDLAAAHLGKGIPRPQDLHLLSDSEALVNYFPFLLDVNGLELVEHRRLASVGADFLRKKYHLVQVADSAWKHDFRAFTQQYVW